MSNQTATIEKTEGVLKLKGPNKYNVIMINDNQTPMDFVVQILVHIFHKTPETAQEVMMEVHEKGRGVAGTYNYEVAEQKCVETVLQSRRHGFPLEVTIEEAE